MSSGLNKYLHGSVWSWIPGERALIVSNDELNTQSPELICLTISNTQSVASVCIDSKNYIQCNQIHVVEKVALGKFEGAVSAPILAAVKSKLSALLNMNTEPSNLQPIRDTAAKLIGQLAKIDTGYVSSESSDAQNELQPPNETVDVAEDTGIGNATSNAALPNLSKETTPSETKPSRKKPGRKPGKKSKPEDNKKSTRPRREAVNYTNEDEAFVLDENHSADEIMQRFNLATKKQAYAVKTYLKARRDKLQSKES